MLRKFGFVFHRPTNTCNFYLCCICVLFVFHLFCIFLYDSQLSDVEAGCLLVRAYGRARDSIGQGISDRADVPVGEWATWTVGEWVGGWT